VIDNESEGALCCFLRKIVFYLSAELAETYFVGNKYTCRAEIYVVLSGFVVVKCSNVVVICRKLMSDICGIQVDDDEQFY